MFDTANDAHRVLVIGAGELGIAVIRSLTSDPRSASIQLSVLLRTSSGSAREALEKELHSLHASIVAGDIANESIDELASTFSSFDTIVSCAGFALPRGTQLKLTEAALRAKVKRFFPWQYGIDYDKIGHGSAQDLFDEQLSVRATLRSQSTVDWVIVSVGVFTSFLMRPDFGIVNVNDRVIRAPGSIDQTITATTAQDIGRIVAEIYYDPKSIHHQVVFVAGDTLNYSHLADQLEKRYGEPFKREVITKKSLQDRLSNDKTDVMAKYLSVWAEGEGVSWPMDSTFNVQRRIPMTNIESYLAST